MATPAPPTEARFKNWQQSGWFSRLTLSFVTPLVTYGHRHKLDPQVRSAGTHLRGPICPEAPM